MSTAGGFTPMFHETPAAPAAGHRYLVHQAGPFDGRLQACRRCGAHLIYYGNIIYRGEAPQSWPVGARVGVSISGRPMRAFLVEDRELEDDEELCRSEREDQQP